MKPSYCPACGRNLRFVGWHHECGVGYAKPAPVQQEKPEAAKAGETKPFSKRDYQREYMRKRRQKAKAQ